MKWFVTESKSNKSFQKKDLIAGEGSECESGELVVVSPDFNYSTGTVLYHA
jgi:hypothetical protein